MRKILINQIVYFFAFIIFFGCASSKLLKKGIEGVYTRNDTENIELHLKERFFSLIDTDKNKHLTLYKCCDTLAFGNWKVESNHFISLSSPKNLKDYVNLEVVEKKDPIAKDTITFIFNNPIEFHYKKYKEKYRELFYVVKIRTKDDFIEKTTRHNFLKFENKINILDFEVDIRIKNDIPLRESLKIVHSFPYKVKNSNSNLFKINIPKLSYSFLSYMRLNDDYIKVINKNKLRWKGKEYIRK